MARCAYCDTRILFGGKQIGERRYCGDKCATHGALAIAAESFSAQDVAHHVTLVHRGNCPKCDGQGPVDVHTSHRVWSALFMTQWSSRPAICCRRCGNKRRLGDAAFSLVLGWWGFPWGVLMTPVQVLRNLVGSLRAPDPERPSAQLEKQLRLHLAQQVVAAQRSPGQV